MKNNTGHTYMHAACHEDEDFFLGLGRCVYMPRNVAFICVDQLKCNVEKVNGSKKGWRIHAVIVMCLCVSR